MLGLNTLIDNWALNRALKNKQAFTRQNYVTPLSNFIQGENLPGWVSMSNMSHYESAVRYNPIVKSAIELLATSSSNGIKYLVDANSGEEILWSDKNEVVQKIKRLIVDRPNAMQSGKEFEKQGIYYIKTFGNRFVHCLRPVGFDGELNIMDVEAMYNLPSQFINVETTGKLYNQIELSSIISKYARTNVNPIEYYDPQSIMHYNDVNISSEQPTIMGISKLEVLKEPIKNTQLVFQAINTLLTQGGARGIISIDSKDGQGTIVPLGPNEKKEVDDTFKNDYGLLNGQNPFILSPVPLTFQKTSMTSKELGLYEEFSKNAIIINNEFGIPHSLLKIDTDDSTYENQIQSVRRLYQDTTIPNVEEYDQYTNFMLRLSNHGVILKTKWDHIPALAENRKEKSTSNSLNVKSALSEYLANVITWNKYLILTDKPPVDGGDIYKFERDKLTNIQANNG